MHSEQPDPNDKLMILIVSLCILAITFAVLAHAEAIDGWAP